MTISYSMPQLNYVSPYQSAASSFNFGSSYTPDTSLVNSVTGNSYLDATASLPTLHDQSYWNSQLTDTSNINWGDYTSGGSDDSGAGSTANSLGMNIPTFQLGLSGLSTLGSLWGAYQSSKLANQQFDYTKSITDKNLANQTQTYNTALTDKATARASMEGWSDAETQDYINKNKLSS